MCDVDFFKQFNDTYGHQQGDDCLQKVARAIAGRLQRPGDLLARYGGEEFAVILPDTEAKDAAVVAENIRKAVEDAKIPHRASKVNPFVTISLGIASTVPASHKTNEIGPLMKQADLALYEAKHGGRNQFRIYRQDAGKKAS